MVGYLKALLLDFDNLDILTRVDIQQALKDLLVEGKITLKHIRILRLYLSGYDVRELPHAESDSQRFLSEVLLQLELKLEWTDDKFIEALLQKYPKYRPIKEYLSRQLLAYGRLL